MFRFRVVFHKADFIKEIRTFVQENALRLDKLDEKKSPPLNTLYRKHEKASLGSSAPADDADKKTHSISSTMDYQQ